MDKVTFERLKDILRNEANFNFHSFKTNSNILTTETTFSLKGKRMELLAVEGLFIDHLSFKNSVQNIDENVRKNELEYKLIEMIITNSDIKNDIEMIKVVEMNSYLVIQAVAGVALEILKQTKQYKMHILYK
jgi:hypothetical protein